MSRVPAHTPSSTRSLRWALRCVAAAGLLIGVLELAVTLAGPAGPAWAVAGFVLVAWVYLAAGITAWWRRPSNRIGAVMVLGTGSWFLANLVNTPEPGLAAIGTLVATVPLAVAVHLLHAFPNGRLSGRAARLTVLASTCSGRMPSPTTCSGSPTAPSWPAWAATCSRSRAVPS